MTAYSKTFSALVTGLLGWGAVVVTSEAKPVTASEWLALGVALATALGVYAVPNGPTQVQVVNPPDEPVPVEDAPAPVKKAAAKRAAERGAIDSGSLALGILIGAALVLLVVR